MIEKFKYAALTLVAVMTMTACGGDDDDSGSSSGPKTSTRNANANTPTRPEYSRLEFPKLKGGNSVVLVRTDPTYGVNYCVEWDTSKKSQRWSCFQWHNKNSGGGGSKYNLYITDPDLPASARWESDRENDPYVGSGYDHGHIVASADRLCSNNMNKQTFYMSNMQPQYHDFNGKLWAKMEDQVRKWNTSTSRDTLYVCKGGTIDHADQILETTWRGLLVPRYFFMAVLCKRSKDTANSGYKAMAFWVEHLNEDHTGDNLKDYIITVDELEELTGIDFFCNLPDDIENKVEAQYAPNAWGFK